MRTEMVEYAGPPGRVAKSDELFSEQHEAHRVAIHRQFRRKTGRYPELTHEISHRRATAHTGKNLVFLCGNHRLLLFSFVLAHAERWITPTRASASIDECTMGTVALTSFIGFVRNWLGG